MNLLWISRKLWGFFSCKFKIRKFVFHLNTLFIKKIMQQNCIQNIFHFDVETTECNENLTSLKFEINIFLWKMCHSKLFHFMYKIFCLLRRLVFSRFSVSLFLFFLHFRYKKIRFPQTSIHSVRSSRCRKLSKYYLLFLDDETFWCWLRAEKIDQRQQSSKSIRLWCTSECLIIHSSGWLTIYEYLIFLDAFRTESS